MGISIGTGNKLEFNEDVLKEKTTLSDGKIELDNISTLKTLFTGYGSYANQISQKAYAISNAAARTRGVDVTYNRNGVYSDTISKLFDSAIDEKIGDKIKDKDKAKTEEKDKDKDKAKDTDKYKDKISDKTTDKTSDKTETDTKDDEDK